MGVLSKSDAQQFRKSQPGLPPVREEASATLSDSEALLADGIGDAGKSGLMLKRGLMWRHAIGLVAAAGLVMMVGFALLSALHAGVDGPPRHGRAERPEAEMGPPPPQTGGSGACDAAQLEESLCPLRSLFADPDVHAVSAANVMKVGKGLLNAADEGFVKDTMAQVFAEVSSILQNQAAPVASALDQIDLNAEEKDAVLVHLALLSDTDVRGFGLEVARAIRESPSPEPDYLRNHIQERLVPRLREMDKFSEKAISGRLLTLWGKGREWSMTLDPVNIQSMESVSGKFVNSYRPKKPMAMKQKMEAVRDAALEMAKSLIDFLLLCVNDMGPEWSTDIGDTMAAAGDGPLSWPCQLDAEGDTDYDFDKGLICPLKFGAQGLDAMRVLSQS